MQQLRFIWDHLVRLRKWILAVCLFMTKATDLLGWLPDRWKQHLELLFPSWGWMVWLLISLVLLAAFAIEESYFRQHPRRANSGKKEFSLATSAMLAIGILWVSNVVWVRVLSHHAAPTAVQGAPPSSGTAPMQPPPVHAIANPNPPKIQDSYVTKATPALPRTAKRKNPEPSLPATSAQSVAPVGPAPIAPVPTVAATSPPALPQPRCNTYHDMQIHAKYGMILDNNRCNDFIGGIKIDADEIGIETYQPLNEMTGKPVVSPSASQPVATQPSSSPHAANPAPQQ